MIKRVNYSGLRTLADVRKERVRVQRNINRVKEHLNDDYESFTDMLTIDYWADFFMNKFRSATPAVSAIYSGFRLVSSLFEGSRCGTKKKRKSGGRSGDLDIEVELEYEN